MGFSIPGGGLFWGVAALLCGIIIMIFPKILPYVLGIYLVVMGLLAILSSM